MPSHLTLIAAHDKNRAVGKGGHIPWSAPEDLRMFKRLTEGGIVIMGRKTFDSLPNGPLKGRKNVVITRKEHGVTDGVIYTSLDGALEIARKAETPCFCIGGGEIYKAMMPHARQMFLTSVDTEIEGADAFFPEYDENEWVEISSVQIRHEAPICVFVNRIRRSFLAGHQE